ncbi:carboxylesterase/lipase family protein [Gordonia sp. TBRC 11910]|uniref:Carboxylic ester hydrolase n=1 Tax=Gordonia asplenii TaxID=2725283 RepID=A0A848L3C9_9ACTN|nr:carboxylesterase family protein [Gordonia asplenii]NMO05027.1 carboxylesterase/lipase family protein [Gordonia asplenii]
MDITVKVTGGDVVGRRTGDITTFLGIPYAAAPVGELAFADPQPVIEWDGARDATSEGPSCWQSPYPEPIHSWFGKVTAPELGGESLNVNVWTPDVDATGLPVMVWIHGGAFVRGANASPMYDGSSFARDGVVLVSINYRLGVYGFLPIEGAPTNLGIRDQIAALQWVQANVAAFGGDPTNVTIFGESAGGMSVAVLMAAPAARGLFAKAIVESGHGHSIVEVDDAKKVTAEMAALLGVDATAEAFAAVDPTDLIAAQNNVSDQIRLAPDPARWGATTISAGGGITGFIPAFDDLVPVFPDEAVAAGAAAGIPLLAGCTAREFSLFSVSAGLKGALTDEILPMAVARFGAGPEVVATYRANHPDESPGDVFDHIVSDLFFRGSMLRLAEGASSTADVFVYEFDWGTPIADLGPCHALELPFVFDALAGSRPFTGPAAPQSLADDIHAAWVRFAKTGNPGWDVYADQRTVHVFNADGGSTGPLPRAADLAALVQS